LAPIKHYLLAAAAVAAAVLLRSSLDPVLGNALPLVTLYGAVAASLWLGGMGPAIVAALGGYFASDYFFIPPRGEFGLTAPGALIGFIAYLFTCSLIIGFGEATRVSRARANEQRELLRVTLGSIGDAVITTNVHGNVTYLNDVAEALTGWTKQQAAGAPLETVFRIVNEETREPVESPATRALREGLVVGLANHTILVRRDGSERPIDDSAAPIRDESGSVSGCVLIFRDVTAQRRQERERASQLMTARLLASIVTSSDDVIVSKSLSGIIQSWNDAAERLFGYTADEAIGRHISLIIPPDRLAEEDRIIKSLEAGQRIDHFETERQAKGGRLIPVSLTISPIKDDEGRVVGASKIARDISIRQELEAERARLATLIENSSDFIGIADLAGVPLFANRAAMAMVGLENFEQVRKLSIWDFFYPEDRARIRDQLIPEVLARGTAEIEVRFRHFKTGAALWMAYKVILLRGRNGEPMAVGTVSQDVTERRRLTNDLRKLAEDLTLADRRKNEFLATLAHELRNPLAPIASMLEVLKRSDGDGAALYKAREVIDRQLKQLVRLVDDLLDLNRITLNRLELRRSDIELTALIREAIEGAQPLLEAGEHRLEVDLPSAPVYLHADPARLVQVFGNLVNNACKYTPRGGALAISAARSGSDVVVRVQDSGIGIPPDKLESIFDMFTRLEQTAVPEQGGLGIGLTLVKQLVAMHGGSIEARSRGQGRGSEFVVRLPALSSLPEASSQASPERTLPRGRRILVVDDNRDAAEALAELLEILGNESHMAHSGREAIAAAERHRPDVVFLDIGLPELNGLEVCRRIRAEKWSAGMVLIALTGWGQEEDRRRSREAGFDGHLVKPVDLAELDRLLGGAKQAKPGAFRPATG
jgi:PAS domain S-box-containing protein